MSAETGTAMAWAPALCPRPAPVKTRFLMGRENGLSSDMGTGQGLPFPVPQPLGGAVGHADNGSEHGVCHPRARAFKTWMCCLCAYVPLPTGLKQMAKSRGAETPSPWKLCGDGLPLSTLPGR